MFGMPGGIEWIIILVVALLIFGRRLPEVMKSMGKGIVEFKKGIKGIEDDVESQTQVSEKESLENAYFANNSNDELKKDNNLK